jgi:Icc protein
MRLLQLSDPHLLADPRSLYRGRRPSLRLRAALEAALDAAPTAADLPDLLLISGDLCQDESWGGYAQLRKLLAHWPTPVALLPGNHDHPQLLRAALGRRATLAPALIELAGARLLLLSSHQPGCTEGWLGGSQLTWLKRRLEALTRDVTALPLLVAVHHPPVPIGDAVMDGIGLADGRLLLELLAPLPPLAGLVFGHVHQYWQGVFPGRSEVPLLGCPSSLCGFGPVQPCPLGRPDDPGGLWLECRAGAALQHRLLRWPAPEGGPA